LAEQVDNATATETGICAVFFEMEFSCVLRNQDKGNGTIATIKNLRRGFLNLSGH
jgi:hypothetical protein